MDIKTKSYINTDVTYSTKLYQKEIAENNKQEIKCAITAVFGVLFIVAIIILFISLCVLGITVSQQILREYAKTLTDMIITWVILGYYSSAVTAVALKLGVFIYDKINDETIPSNLYAPSTFFVSPKYLKFFWKEGKLWVFREEVRGKRRTNHLSRLLESIGIIENNETAVNSEEIEAEKLFGKLSGIPQIYYHDGIQDIRLPNIMHITAEELSKMREQTIPLQAKVNLCTEGEIQIYLRRKEDV